MNTTPDLAALNARIEELEAQNRALSAKSPGGSKGRWRTALAIVLIVLTTLLAPVALICSWARAELVDTGRFVQTFAPLAERPEVQTYVVDQTVLAIEEKLDIDAMVGDVFDGIGSLNLPPRSSAALALLEGPAAEGLRSTIRTQVENVVTSPQFAQLWASALRETHSRAVALIQGDPNAVVQLSDDGVITLQLSILISEVKRVLLAQGMGFADQIPEIQRTIPLLASDSLVLVRTVYQLSAALGYWLPVAVLGLLVLGVIAARNRLRALAWAGLGLTISFLLLAAGIGVGRLFFVAAVSPSIMPTTTAQAVFGQLTELLSAGITALAVLTALIALSAWLFGGSRAAVGLRAFGGWAFGNVRAARGWAGLDPRGFGSAVERGRPTILVAAAAIGVLALFLMRPITLGGVVGTLVALVLVVILVELLRKPTPSDT